jgi:nitrate/nitrite transporter NarK
MTVASESQTATLTSELRESDVRYPGWRVVLAASLGVMGGFGSLFVFTFAVFVKPLSAQFGWSREAISAGFAIAAVTLGVVSPFLGRWLDRFGPRRIILACVTVFSCGIASLALLKPQIWQFYLTCLLLGLVGNGAAHLAYSRSISTWFRERLGLALAIVMVGAGLGAMILPLFAQSIVSALGWRATYAALGALALLLGFPLSWRYVRERAQPSNPSASVVLSGMTWQQGLLSLSFWIIVVVLFVGSIAMNGAITHMVALLTDRKITAHDAALCASALGGSSLLGRIGAGWLLDRFFAARVAFLMNVLGAMGLFLLAHANTFSAGAAAAALIGIALGGEAAITPYLLTRYFGLRAFSTLYGVTWTFYAAAGATGPIILGRSFDLTGSYTSLLVSLAAALALAAGFLLFLPRYPSSETVSLTGGGVAN